MDVDGRAKVLHVDEENRKFHASLPHVAGGNMQLCCRGGDSGGKLACSSKEKLKDTAEIQILPLASAGLQTHVPALRTTRDERALYSMQYCRHIV